MLYLTGLDEERAEWFELLLFFFLSLATTIIGWICTIVQVTQF